MVHGILKIKFLNWCLDWKILYFDPECPLDKKGQLWLKHYLRNYIDTSAFADVSYLMADVEAKLFV